MTVNQMTRLGAGTAALCLAVVASAAQATEGYVALGFGPVQRGQGGAGVADPGSDAMASTINPAAVAGLGHSLSFGAEVFMPDRGYTGTGTQFVGAGSWRSGRDVFLIPNFAYNRPLANGAVLNFAAYGNGGMNTSYSAFARSNPCPAGTPGTGVYCFGAAGVDLTQLFLSVTYAQKSGPLAWGIAPTLAVQGFKASGLGAFGGISSDPANLTDRGRDYSYGIGLRAGLSYEVSPTLRLGLSGQTKINMTKFDNYAGLFENGGDFDIPANISAGVAWDATPALTVMLDYQKIFYSGIPAIGNGATALPLGAVGGTGFGWDDVDVVKLGLAWAQNDRMTWRAGYAHASNPIGPEDVTLGILAPGVVTNHYTLGGSWAASDRDTVDFSVVYAPNVQVVGVEMTPQGPTPGQVGIDMNQFAVSIGWSRKF
ncbi:MAG: outer membrane protein transport protein [Paracoccaceae bacterium]